MGYNGVMLCTLIWSLTSLAQAGGFYHPDDIAGASAEMARASEGLTAGFDERAKDLRKVAVALQQYRVSLELLGTRAPQAEWDRLAALEKQYHREEAVLQAFADELITDFDTTMKGALDAALAAHPGATRCRAEIEVPGPRVPGMRARTKPNPDCEGENLNAALATAMDGNAELVADISEMLALEWPGVTLEESPQRAVGEGVVRWVNVRALATTVAPGQLKAIEREDDLMRLDIDAALEGEEPDLERLKTRVAEIERATGAARAKLGGAILDTAARRLAKSGETTGWCANPAALGGCEGTNATGEVVPELGSDKKFGKWLAKELRD